MFFALLLTLTVSAAEKQQPELGKMVSIEGGRFVSFLKDPETGKPKEEDVPSFLMDVFPVTEGEYLKFLQANPSWKKNKVAALFADSAYLKGGLKKSRSPVVNVSWFSARAYCAWRGKRMPLVSEWEWAGWQSRVRDEDKPAAASDILKWYEKRNSRTIAVGNGLPNRLGLYDMHGLVWEWVEDFSTVVMPARGDTDMEKLFCGAGVLGAADPADYASFLRYGMRSSLKAKYAAESLGFRCVK